MLIEGDPNMIIDKEEIELLAYRLYKQNAPYEKMIWRLAELCTTLIVNLDLDENGDLYKLTSIEEIRANLKNNHLIKPDEARVKKYAEKLLKDHPESSKLHWYIAEKTLILEKLTQLIENNIKN
ncbi:MAG: hypothetical protein ACTSU2_09690 [Promethearchaeota archaeon]